MDCLRNITLFKIFTWEKPLSSSKLLTYRYIFINNIYLSDTIKGSKDGKNGSYSLERS